MRSNDLRLQTERLLGLLAIYHVTMEGRIKSQDSIDELGGESILDPEADLDDFENADEDPHETYYFEFARSLRYSFVVLLFMVIENTLNQLCELIRNSHHLAIRVTDLRGDAIERYKTYLHRLAAFPSVNWSQLEDLAVVRNCLVHTLGHIEQSRDRDRLQRLVAEDKGIVVINDLWRETTLIIKAKYCSYAITIAQEFFDALFDGAGIHYSSDAP